MERRQATCLQQQPPFEVLPETLQRFLVPANAVYAEDGMTIATPATLYWNPACSGTRFGRLYGLPQPGLIGVVLEYDRTRTRPFRAKLAEIEGRALFAARKR